MQNILTQRVFTETVTYVYSMVAITTLVAVIMLRCTIPWMMWPKTIPHTSIKFLSCRNVVNGIRDINYCKLCFEQPTKLLHCFTAPLNSYTYALPIHSAITWFSYMAGLLF